MIYSLITAVFLALTTGCLTQSQKDTAEAIWDYVPVTTPTPLPTPTPAPTPVPEPTPIPEPIHTPATTLELNNRVVAEMAAEYDIAIVERNGFMFLDLRERDEHWEYCYQQWHERTGSWDNFPTWRAGREQAGFTSEVR